MLKFINTSGSRSRKCYESHQAKRLPRTQLANFPLVAKHGRLCFSKRHTSFISNMVLRLRGIHSGAFFAKPV